MKLSSDEYGATILLSKKEYQDLKNIFLDCAGWKHDDPPHIINLRTITIEGHYKWHPTKSYKLRVEVEQEKKKTRKKQTHEPQLHKPYKSIPGDKI